MIAVLKNKKNSLHQIDSSVILCQCLSTGNENSLADLVFINSFNNSAEFLSNNGITFVLHLLETPVLYK